MTPEQWAQIKKIFEEAVELDAAGRSKLLERLDREDPPAAAQIRNLLEEFDSPGDSSIPAPLESMVLEMGIRTPERVGPYRVVRELGRGGSGIVLLAIRESGDSHTAVALKLLRSSNWDTARERRFSVERSILARLKHPAITKLLDSGVTTGGIPYLVMEYVDGEPLDAYCTRNSLDVPQRLHLFLRVLEVVDLAHRTSVIHRDLKPANILVTPHGQIKLLDFGISKLLEVNVDTTSTLERRFTPAYASPEQIRGERPVPATDIYALGVILYELLTGHSPYDNEITNLDEISHAVLHEKPPAPGTSPRADQALAAQIGRDLKFITLRALEKEARARYASVEEFAGEIRTYLAGRPLTVGRGHGWTAKLAWSAVGLAILVAALIFAQRARSRPVVFHLSAPKVLSGDSALSAYPSVSQDGRWLVYASDRGGAQALHLWLRDLSGSTETQLTHGDRDDIDPSISPDGKRVAFRSERDPKGVYVLSISEPSNGRKEEFAAAFGLSPRFSHDGKWLTFWFKDPRTDFGTSWKLPIDQSREPLRSARGFEDAHNPAWMPDGRHLILCGTRRSNGGPAEEHDFWVMDQDTDQAYKTGAFAILANRKIDPHIAYLPATSFQPLREGLVFTGEQAGKVGLWVLPLDTKTWKASGEPYPIDEGPANELHASVFKNGASFASARISVGIWILPIAANSGRVTGTLKRIDSDGPDLMPSISSDGQTLVFLRQHAGRMRLYRWTASGMQPIGSSLESNRLKVSPDGHYIFFRVMEGTSGEIQQQAIYRASIDSGKTERVCRNCGGPTHSSSDGRFVLFETGSATTRIAVLRVGREERWDLLRHSHHPVGSARFSPDGRWVAFELDQGLDGRQILVAPFREDGLSEKWAAITPEHAFAAEPWWSPDGSRLYFLDRRDGFTCVWTRKWNNATAKPEGEAQPVQHFHEARMGPLLSVNRGPRYIGLSVANDRLVLALSDITSEIRSGELTPASIQH
jgi:serine/threonine protein kinase